MPTLVRYSISPDAYTAYEPNTLDGRMTTRERRLYVALAILLSLNLTAICGALTFFGLLYGS